MQKAFLKTIQLHQKIIHKVSRVYRDTREDQQDLFQEIVFQLWKSFPDFRGDSKVSTWIYRIALNTAISQLNKQKKRGNHVPIDEALMNKPDVGDHLEEEQLSILYDQIKKLNPIEKGIILLYLEGKTYEEIAAITGFSASNTGTRLNRIKQKLKAQIK